jgi:D-amino-acid dehydrogenase
VTKHVVVIGAGVVGLCVGLYCAEHGFDVTIVERNGEERDGCSFGNAGTIVPHAAKLD